MSVEKNNELSLILIKAILEDLCHEGESLKVLEEIFVNKNKQKEIEESGIFVAFPFLKERDITSYPIFEDNKTIQKTKIICKEDGIISGLEVVQKVFKIINPKIKLTFNKKNGESVKKEEDVILIEGVILDILIAERTALNFLCHLSGIATEVNNLNQKIKHTKCKILDTRKTLPGLRVFQKKAVKDGGGINHRFGLFDQVMIKDNHIDASGSITEAFEKIKNQHDSKYKIIVENRNLKEVEETLKLKPDRILLDNMTPEEVVEALNLIQEKVQTEVSGNMNKDSLVEYAETGVDYISIGGKLTLNSPRLDFSLRKNFD